MATRTNSVVPAVAALLGVSIAARIHRCRGVAAGFDNRAWSAIMAFGQNRTEIGRISTSNFARPF
jgi:hypothetical protein